MKKLNKLLITSLILATTVVGYGSSNVAPRIASRTPKTINNSAGKAKVSSMYTSISQDFRQKYIILHYTAIGRDASIRALTEKEVSSHFLISDDASDPIFALVDEDRRAWHAGSSSWKTRTNLNDSSLGIEIVNMGNTGEDIYAPYTEAQIKNVAVLVKYLADKYEIPAENILGHSDIAPQRKSDPGPLFPWKKLYEQYGIGMWYDEYTKQGFESQYRDTFYGLRPSEAQAELKKFGYEIEITNMWDKQTENVVKAFQHRFRPTNFDGVVDLETYSILKALNVKYNGVIR